MATSLIWLQLWLHREPANGRYQSIISQRSGLVSPLAFPDMALEVASLLS